MEEVYTSADGDMLQVTDPKVAQFINDMEEAGFEWRTYSGRGMYGKQTAGVTCDTGDCPDSQEVIRATKVELCGDGMGRGTILYVHTTR